jgi:hypothetical protein
MMEPKRASLNVPAPITIHEDDAVKFKQSHRSRSMPELLLLKTIMKCKTLDDSLHSTYGSQSDNFSGYGEKSIKFDKIVIREYSRTIGDNPSCSCGPPVSISWEYNAVGAVDLDEFESTRPPRRSHFEMVLPRKVRQDMLKRDWDVTQRQIAEAVRNNVKTKNQRKSTVNNIGKATKVEEFMESAGRKVMRVLKFQKSVGGQVKDLEAKLNEHNRIRQQQLLEISMAGEYSEEPTDAVDTSTTCS